MNKINKYLPGTLICMDIEVPKGRKHIVNKDGTMQIIIYKILTWNATCKKTKQHINIKDKL